MGGDESAVVMVQDGVSRGRSALFSGSSWGDCGGVGILLGSGGPRGPREPYSAAPLPPVRVDRATARTAGVLFITATVASLASTALMNPIITGRDYLTKTFAHQDRVITGSFFLIVSAFASAGIAIALYPKLSSYGRGLALGSVSFRVMEGVMYLVGAVAVLMLVPLSHDAARMEASPAYIQTSGSLVQTLHDKASVIGVMAFYLGALMYYWIFFRSGLIPRWLSEWGLVGATLGFFAALLVLFRVITSMSALQVGLNVPIGVNEVVLALWLIVKGFNSPQVHEQLLS